MTKATIQGDVLEWALQDAGVDRSDALAQIGLTPISDGKLSGDVELEVESLNFLAKLTHRSPFFFALPEPPDSDRHSVSANFRAPITNSGQSRALHPDERAALRDAKRRQQMAVKLSIELDQAPVPLVELRDHESPELAAARVAEWLGWSSIQERRKRIKSKTQLFVALRGLIEDCGIMTNVIPVDGDAFRGFALHHDRVPLIFVNASLKSPSARSFTLVHELAHLLRGVDKACDKRDLQSRTSDEAWCNRFAAAFLMPQGELTVYLEKHLKKTFIQSGDLDSVRRISNYFYCSWFSVAIRLKQLNLGDDALIAAVSGDFLDPDPAGFVPGGQTRAQKRLAAFGLGFARLFDSALSAAKVSEIEVRKVLRLQSGTELQDFFALGRGSE